MLRRRRLSVYVLRNVVMIRLIALLGISAFLVSCESPRGVRVVLVTLDTLRYGALLGAPGQPSSMPRTLAWARDNAVIFERFYASVSATSPTHATIFTGLHPWQHGVTRNKLGLDERFLTLAECFKEAGFATAAVVASSAAVNAGAFARGFDSFTMAKPGVTLDADGRTVSNDRVRRRYALGGEVEGQALQALESLRSERQFLWFHFFDPHTPYGDSAGDPERVWSAKAREQAIAAGDGGQEVFRRVQRLYSADVQVLDAILLRLIERLEQDSERLETHIVITSDHGECLEEGRLGHGRHLVEQVVHVPTLIASPRMSPGVRRDVAGSIDLFTTLLSLAGVRREVGGGRDLLQERDSSGAMGMRMTFEQPLAYKGADGLDRLIDGELLYFVTSGGVVYRSDCDRLIVPPGLDISPAGERRLLSRFEEACRQLSQGPQAASVAPETEAELRALGYVE
jgi:arylsulfatase A-like enzyme